MSKPPVVAELVWNGELRFRARSDRAALVLDGDSQAGPSPVQALALALAGCMSVDVVHILRKGRHDLRGLTARIEGHRAESDPHRFVAFDLRFVVAGDVPADKVERAIALSRETYCSVWHTLRPDVELTTSFEVVP